MGLRQFRDWPLCVRKLGPVQSGGWTESSLESAPGA
ncbi:hypothetical protein chiPu_0028712, partial [Chiloscyllium punctatum]|nr:hypothetical protein [Chiloscyllium punctatum]